MFADFRVDTEESINQYLASDFDYWKVGRLGKDSGDLLAIKDLCRANFTRLKEVRVGAIA